MFSVLDAQEKRRMVVLETNSCPCGSEVMPQYLRARWLSYSILVASDSLKRLLTAPNHEKEPEPHVPNTIEGDLAIIYDQDFVEATGYAMGMAEVYNERVWKVEFHYDD